MQFMHVLKLLLHVKPQPKPSREGGEDLEELTNKWCLYVIILSYLRCLDVICKIVM